MSDASLRRAMKYFTIEEAEALIPKLEKIYAAVGDIVAKAQLKSERIRKLESGKDVSQLAIEQSQLQFLAKSANDLLQKIADFGAQPKGIDPALVDFPYRVRGEEVYLCWRLGDKAITHYHGLQEGFAGRKPLPKKPKSNA